VGELWKVKPGGQKLGSHQGGEGALCGSIVYEDATGGWAYHATWSFNAGVSMTTPKVESGDSCTSSWDNRWLDW
jgi:hypothetical protein